jgi:hypothetical protein
MEYTLAKTTKGEISLDVFASFTNLAVEQSYDQRSRE